MERLKTVSVIVVPLVVVIVILDQWTKIAVEEALHPEQIVPIIDGFFNLTLTFNKGAAALMQPAPEAAFDAYRVDPKVNSNRASGPDLIAPLAA